ncbi:serine hydrolase [Ruminococcus sp. NK3A76]|uniref:serine hydrolase domain-containing protein n=1 Tax=Ruminococcus sp. NK3A76 TaxID=877411 RepID=UPI00068F33C3|nr:serine hydrolase [Ruminococcus sp. NK3A76]
MYDAISDMLKAAGLDIYALEVVRNGKIVLHESSGDDVRRPVYSAAKSITSAAFSLACDDGLIEADTPLAAFLENRYAHLCRPEFAVMPLKRFLTMTAGNFPFRPSGYNWLEYILSLDTDCSDASFHYSNIPAYLVGVAVENAVGGDLPRFLQKRLFSPLGIRPPEFAFSPEGHYYGATGLSLTVHELAAFGTLYLGGGSIGKQHIISKASVIEATYPHVRTTSGDSYGYFFRVAEDHFSAVGKWGQRCMVYPGKHLVIAYLSHQPERSDELYKLFCSYADSIR